MKGKKSQHKAQEVRSPTKAPGQPSLCEAK